LLLWLAGYVLEHRPRTVVDLGSGQSSVWMAAAMRTAGYDGRVIGVDHDEDFAQGTRELARRQGVQDWLTVIHAPLREQEIGGRAVRWYNLDALTEIEGIDLMCIDGPPGQGTSHARWPALPALHDRLSADAVVVLDDMIRRDEQEILDDWTTRLPGFAVERLDFEKGAAIMRRQSRA
jgi:predicted O-methyltransferase YrrM